MRVYRSHTAIMASAETRTWRETQGMFTNPAVFRRRKTDKKEGSDREERKPESPYGPGLK